jgi:hypothetical protein
MRRILLACVFALGATAALAGNPFYLDHTGTLWNATSTQSGLLLTATRGGSEIMRSVVPFPIAIAGSNDAQIQVAADDLSGKVVVVWQRNWSANASEIMLAVWRDGSWERIEHLSNDLASAARNPAIKLSTVATTVPDPENPDDGSKATLVEDSFLSVVWWEGSEQSHGVLAVLRLTSEPGDEDALVEHDLDRFTAIGLPCSVPVPPEVLEHPVFADRGPAERLFLFFGSQRLCLFPLLQVSFTLQTTPVIGSDGITVIAQRRRHIPIFGLTKVFPMTQDLSMEGARMLLGPDLNPVAYRVAGGNLEYLTYTNTGWSPLRTLPVKDGLTMDQAIPLVENLAR